MRVWHDEVGQAAGRAGDCGKCEFGVDVDAVGLVCQGVRVILEGVGVGLSVWWIGKPENAETCNLYNHVERPRTRSGGIPKELSVSNHTILDSTRKRVI